MLDLTRLRVFREVATLGSFTRAAESLGYTQPSVSHHIAQLERELGAQLFERQPRRVRLTAAGQVFLGHAQAVLVRLIDAQREVAETAQAGGGLLRVAAFATAAATLIPAAAGAFRRRLPSVKLRFTEADPQDALPRLLAGDQDLAIVYDYPALGERPGPAADLEPMFADHMAVALPSGHPMAGAASVPLAALGQDDWIVPHDSVCRDAVVFACRNAGFTPAVVSETNDYLAMQGLVAAGLGVALLPRLAGTVPQRPGVLLRPLADPVIDRVTFVASRPGAYRSPVMDAFRAALRDALAQPAGLGTGLPLEAFDPQQAAARPDLVSGELPR
jgi:DNA-binding transcriptional LysR family regulator